jgi:predicted nucleic-acid-binding protein
MAISSGSLDANVLLRLLLNDVADQHLEAMRLLQNASGQFAVADTAIIEVVFVLERNYKLTRLQIYEAVQGLIALAQINCNRNLFEKVLPIFTEHAGLSFEDCCLATYAELEDANPLWTFDKKLANQTSNTQLVSADLLR